MDKYIGKKLEGRYEILELIGFGGMAMVFKAYDILENRYVAIKILKDEYLQSDDFKRRFRNESKAIAVLSHPSIVKVYDVNFSDNIQYIVMEYIDGITLKEYIEQQGKVRWKEAVHFTVQILRALQHAHDNGIVHRDIKPQNVMLLQDGTIKVMDFGIARFARETGRTMSDKAIGSVHYISPEQAKGDTTDEKTDIYAVGVMMYEMLTGKVPFDGDTPVSIAIKQMQIEPKRPSEVNPDIPFGLEEIILRAMQKDPLLRYQTASEMLKDIDEFKHNPSVVFEYKYIGGDGTTKYFDKVSDSRVRNESEPAPKKSYLLNILAGVTAACVILAIVALYVFWKASNSSVEELVLPNFVGMTVDQAQKETENKVSIIITEEQASTVYEKGEIINQVPGYNTAVKINSTVKVIVSSGLQEIVMPDLVNETSSVAKTRLNAMGIKNVVVTRKIDDKVQKGRIIMTEPAAETVLKPDDEVVLYVSTGAPDVPIKVPSLLGMTEVQARSELGKLKLRVGTVELVDSAEERGTVIWQSVEEGETLEKQGKVDIKISNGASAGAIEISIPFTKQDEYGFDVEYMDAYFSFEIVINGEYATVMSVNPAQDESLDLAFSLVDGKINGQIDEASTNTVEIIVDGSTFAEYEIDFEDNHYFTIKKPDLDLLTDIWY